MDNNTPDVSDATEVTSSGDAHKGFHMNPNVLRDRYLPLLGPDGYGYLTYLLSWCNARVALSQRRQMRDLGGIGQTKLERMQGDVLHHCGQFVHRIPGTTTRAARWHIDLKALWRENLKNEVRRAREELAGEAETAKGGVPNINTPSVANTDTPRTQDGYTPYPKSVHIKDKEIQSQTQGDKEKTVAHTRDGLPGSENGTGPDAGEQQQAANAAGATAPSQASVDDKSEPSTEAAPTKPAASKKKVPPPAPRLEDYPQAAALLEIPGFAELWGDWEAHRKEIKKPLTPMSVKYQLIELAAEADPLAMLRHTVGKGYTGLRAPDSANSSTGGRPGAKRGQSSKQTDSPPRRDYSND